MASMDCVHPDVLMLADLMRAEWPAVRERIRVSGHPTCEGDEGEDDTTDDADDATDDATDDKAGDTEVDDKPVDKTDWKAQSRKHEREAKKARAERDAHAKKLAEIEASNLSEKEKEIATAREEARAEALAEAGKERRADKLELAVTRIAVSRGVTVEGKTVKFSDPDDVQMWLERQIAKGDIDGDEIYADGMVDDDALTAALTDLAVSKPGWLVGAPVQQQAASAGSVDAGKGGASKGIENMSVADHIKRKQMAVR